jgi:hypothetical protein
MPDTVRTVTDVTTNLLQDGQAAGAITPQDMRDAIVSSFSIYATTQAGSYTAVLADIGTAVEMTSATPVNFTVPPNASVAFPIGGIIEVLQYGAGQVTLVAGAGVTLRTPTGTLTTRAQYSSVMMRKRATNEWVVAGDLT